MAYSIDDLPDELVEEAESLYGRLEVLMHADPSADAVHELEVLGAEAARIEVPELAMLAGMLRFIYRGQTKSFRAALGDYGAAMRLITDHPAIFDASQRRVVLDAAQVAVLAMILLPEVAGAQIEEFLDAIETEHRNLGISTASVAAWRAMWAAERGDLAAVEAGFEEFHATRRRGEEELSVGFELEVGAYRDHPERALRLLEARRAAETQSDKSAIILGSQAGWLLSVTGRRAEAHAEARDLIDTYGIETVLEHAFNGHLLRAVEDDPLWAPVVVAYLREEADVDDPTDGFDIAEIARHELRLDPDSPEGSAHRAVAEAYAARLDARNGNDLHSRRLRELYFADL